ncbi:MAG: HAMP domain-containing sensor histidine kinase, partial [Pseudomonadota bacterium]
LVDDLVESEQLSMQGDISLNSEIPKGMAVRADGEQLYRVIGNLTRNARQALEAAQRPGTITISSEQDAEAWWIRVKDDGPGLLPKAQEKLFTPFQGGARKGGSGLGLAIAAELVRGHGGTLDLEKTGPHGTTFSICLPKARLADQTAHQEAKIGVAKLKAAAYPATPRTDSSAG